MNIDPATIILVPGQVAVRVIKNGECVAIHVIEPCARPCAKLASMFWGGIATLTIAGVFYILAAAVCAIAPDHW